MVGWPTFLADVGHPTMATGWVGPPHSGMAHLLLWVGWPTPKWAGGPTRFPRWNVPPLPDRWVDPLLKNWKAIAFALFQKWNVPGGTFRLVAHGWADPLPAPRNGPPCGTFHPGSIRRNGPPLGAGGSFHYLTHFLKKNCIFYYIRD